MFARTYLGRHHVWNSTKYPPILKRKATIAKTVPKNSSCKDISAFTKVFIKAKINGMFVTFAQKPSHWSTPLESMSKKFTKIWRTSNVKCVNWCFQERNILIIVKIENALFEVITKHFYPNLYPLFHHSVCALKRWMYARNYTSCACKIYANATWSFKC